MNQILSPVTPKTVAYRAPTGIIITAVATQLYGGPIVYSDVHLFDDDEYVAEHGPGLPFDIELSDGFLVNLPPMPDDMIHCVVH